MCKKNSHLSRGRRENALALYRFKREKRHLIRWLISSVMKSFLIKEKKKEKKNLTLFLISEWPVFLISCLMNYLQTPWRPFTLHLHLGSAPEEGALIYETLPWIQLCSLPLLCESDHVPHLREEWRSSPHTSAPLWSQSNGWSEFLQGCQLFNLWKIDETDNSGPRKKSPSNWKVWLSLLCSVSGGPVAISWLGVPPPRPMIPPPWLPPPGTSTLT